MTSVSSIVNIISGFVLDISIFLKKIKIYVKVKKNLKLLFRKKRCYNYSINFNKWFIIWLEYKYNMYLVLYRVQIFN